MPESNEIRFNVPLPGSRRHHTLTFTLQETVAEEHGCVKVKPATDGDGSTFLLRIILLNEMKALPEAEETRRQINSEIGYLKLLDHRNVLKVLQVFSTHDRVYVLTEPCRQTLREYTDKRGGKVGEDDARDIFRQILGATAYLHGKGLAHRCLNPDTVLNDSENGVKVAHFRSAMLQSTKQLLTDRPRDMVAGYTAPELLRGDAPYSGKMADVFSCGALLHYLLVGEAPSDPVAPDLSAVTKASEPASTIVDQMLAVDWKGQGDGLVRQTIQGVRSTSWVCAGQERRQSDAPRPLSPQQVRRSFRQMDTATGGAASGAMPMLGAEQEESDDESPCATDPSDAKWSPLPVAGPKRRKDDIDVDKAAELMPAETPANMPLSPLEDVPASPASRTRKQLSCENALDGDYQDATVEDDGVTQSPMGSRSKKGAHRVFPEAAAPAEQAAIAVQALAPAADAEAAGDSLVAAAIHRVVLENEEYMEKTGLQHTLADMIVFLLGSRPRGSDKFTKLLKWARHEKEFRGQH
eukprot:TRINITY_DN13730_c0_g2_i1.p1 TRINITY_DN13730_c0_g2~~TRINITY_DN13730_c0_g2_i1.p1  ORF type:complete len:544 (+),score=157.86 TRINITY_DN13730_c0_g2_i1:65-1633(+)